MSRIIEGLVDDFPDDDDFWLKASELSLDSIWDNSEDDVYAELLNDTSNKLTHVRQCFVKTKKEITEQ